MNYNYIYIIIMIYIYTDGSCINNGKKNAKAGIGVYFGENDERNVSKRIKGKQTNNTAELKAILKAMKIIKKEDNFKDLDITIYTDSKYSILCATSYGKKNNDNNWCKQIANKELVQKLYRRFNKYDNISLKYIKAHTNNNDIHSIGNSMADYLANKCL